MSQRKRKLRPSQRRARIDKLTGLALILTALVILSLPFLISTMLP